METLPKVSSGVQEAALNRMLQSGSQEVVALDERSLSPVALGAYLCLHTLKAKNPQANYVLETLQRSSAANASLVPVLPLHFQGRLGFPHASSACFSSARTWTQRPKPSSGTF